MKILIFILVVGIASVVFYLFLRKVFDQRLDKVEDEPGKDKIKPLLPEETKKDEAFEEDSAGEENESKEEPAKEELPKDEQQSEATDNCCGTTIDSEQHDEKQNQ